MSRSFSFHPAARHELRESVRHYEAETAGLGTEFAADVRIAVDRLLLTPHIGAPPESGTRRKLLQRFPYSLIYLVEGDDEHLLIVAVMHHRRDPEYWRTRLTT